MILKKIFFKLMNNAVFGKTMENVRKQILSLSPCHNRNKVEVFSIKTKLSQKLSFFIENLLAIEMEKTKNKKNWRY